MAKKQPQGPSGLMVIDKPAGMSSHDAVSQMRRIAGTGGLVTPDAGSRRDRRADFGHQ